MKGDAWKYKADHKLIRKIMYLINNLRIEYNRFGCRSLGSESYAFDLSDCMSEIEQASMQLHDPLVVSYLTIGENMASFYIGNRYFRTCPGCGDWIESRVKNFMDDYVSNNPGVCWRCKPEEYAKEK